MKNPNAKGASFIKLEPELYIFKPTYFMSSYILQALENKKNFMLVGYKKRKLRNIDKLRRFLRAYFVNRRGLWTERIIDKRLLEATKNITSRDKVLFFGVDNLKDLRILEQEITSNWCNIYLWNTASSRYRGWLQLLDFKTFVKGTGMKVYTFDSQDATRYGLRLTSQIYRPLSDREVAPMTTAQSDVFFVGKEKQRSLLLAHIVMLLNKAGAKTDKGCCNL